MITLRPLGGGEDDSVQIQEAIDSLADVDSRWPNTAGGVIRLQKGEYTLRERVHVHCAGVTIEGEGNTSTFACTLNWYGSGPMFRLPVTEDKYTRSTGFRMADICLRRRAYSKAAVAFDFGELKLYDRGWRFDRVSASYFDKVFALKRGKASVLGSLECTQCSFNYNTQVLDATDASLNQSRFRDCLMTKNGVGDPDPDRYAFDFKYGNNVIFDGCNIEHQPRAIRARKVQAFTISACRFERNVGSTDPVVLFEKSKDIWVHRCFHRIVRDEENSDTTTLHFRDCEDIDYSHSRLRKIIVEKNGIARVVLENNWEPL